jgi:hypothetical protein
LDSVPELIALPVYCRDLQWAWLLLVLMQVCLLSALLLPWLLFSLFLSNSLVLSKEK